MPRTLTQITFDFAGEPQENTPSSVVAEEPVIQKQEKMERNEVKKEVAVKKTASRRGRRSLKEIELNAGLVDVPEDEVLFKKQYYSIGEVASMFHENQSLIRYWETEFDILQPRKNRKGDRFFRPIDIKNLVLIYDLLRKRKFTIEGAKTWLKKNSAKQGNRAEEKFAMIQSLEKIKGFLLELKASL